MPTIYVVRATGEVVPIHRLKDLARAGLGKDDRVAYSPQQAATWASIMEHRAAQQTQQENCTKQEVVLKS